MFIRNKQKGFISAELGIGILIISLLTILGFLAAMDLDDEISRSSGGSNITGPYSGELQEVIDVILALETNTIGKDTLIKIYEDAEATGLENQHFGNYVFEAVVPAPLRSSFKFQPNMGQSSFYELGDLMFVFKTFYDNHMSYELVAGHYASGPETFQRCLVLVDSLQDVLPKLNSVFQCNKDSVNRVIDLTIRPTPNSSSQSGTISEVYGYNEDSSLNGTWMGDL